MLSVLFATFAFAANNPTFTPREFEYRSQEQLDHKLDSNYNYYYKACYDSYTDQISYTATAAECRQSNSYGTER